MTTASTPAIFSFLPLIQQSPVDHMLRKAVMDGIISAVEFEKAAKGMINDIM